MNFLVPLLLFFSIQVSIAQNILKTNIEFSSNIGVLNLSFPYSESNIKWNQPIYSSPKIYTSFGVNVNYLPSIYINITSGISIGAKGYQYKIYSDSILQKVIFKRNELNINFGIKSYIFPEKNSSLKKSNSNFQNKKYFLLISYNFGIKLRDQFTNINIDLIPDHIMYNNILHSYTIGIGKKYQHIEFQIYYQSNFTNLIKSDYAKYFLRNIGIKFLYYPF